jgi:hypothetical protein
VLPEPTLDRSLSNGNRNATTIDEYIDALARYNPVHDNLPHMIRGRDSYTPYPFVYSEIDKLYGPGKTIAALMAAERYAATYRSQSRGVLLLEDIDRPLSDGNRNTTTKTEYNNALAKYSHKYDALLDMIRSQNSDKPYTFVYSDFCKPVDSPIVFFDELDKTYESADDDAEKQKQKERKEFIRKLCFGGRHIRITTMPRIIYVTPQFQFVEQQQAIGRIFRPSTVVEWK